MNNQQVQGSEFELVLPKNVIDTCYHLPYDQGARFVSSDQHLGTATVLSVNRQADFSIKIHISTQPLDSQQPEYLFVDEVKKKSTEQDTVPENFVQYVVVAANDTDTDTDTDPPNQSLIIDQTERPTENENISLVDFMNKSEEKAIISPSANNKQNLSTDIEDSVRIQRPNAEYELKHPDETIYEFASILDTNETIVVSSAALSDFEKLKSSTNLSKDQISQSRIRKKSRKDYDCKNSTGLPKASLRGHNHTCYFCSVKLKSYETLLRHLKRKHSGESEYLKECDAVFKFSQSMCEVCHKKFNTKFLLDAHRLRMHKPHKHAECNICGLKVKSDAHLIEHVRRVHEEIKTKECLCHLCSASFKFESYLKQHIKTVHGEKHQFMCDQCEYTCSSSKYLSNHKYRRHRPKKCVCSECPVSFRTPANLKRHIYLVHSRTPKAFSCSDCSKSFSTRSNLKEHVAVVHLKTSRYSCLICQAGLRTKSKVDEHMEKNHPQIQPFIKNQTLILPDSTNSVQAVNTPGGVPTKSKAAIPSLVVKLQPE